MAAAVAPTPLTDQVVFEFSRQILSMFEHRLKLRTRDSFADRDRC